LREPRLLDSEIDRIQQLSAVSTEGGG
jgi:hypothetical protein